MHDPIADGFENERWPAEEPSGCVGYLVRLAVFAAVLALIFAAAMVLVGCGGDDGRTLVTGPSLHPSSTVQGVDGLAGPLDRFELAFADGYRPPPPPPPPVHRPRASRGTPRSTIHRSAIGDCSGWAHLVSRYPWTVGTACAVLACESGGNPNARNPSSSATGLFQILGGPVDPAANVARAYAMWHARGWQPWNASRACWT